MGLMTGAVKYPTGLLHIKLNTAPASCGVFDLPRPVNKSSEEVKYLRLKRLETGYGGVRNLWVSGLER